MTQLFHWDSAALKRYGDGDIVVMAGTADEARGIVRAQAAEIYAKEWSAPDATDDWDMREWNNWLAQLEQDLAKDPTVTPGFVFIWGSE